MFGLIKKNKEIVWSLAVNDFSTKYAGSLFGTFWAFIQPVVTILIYACVFQYGLKSESPIPNVSYIFWFASGMIPWFFFSDGIRAVTNVMLEYSYLVKKVVFEIELLPIIKIIATLFIHFVFICLLFLIAFVNGEIISIHVIQLIYYVFCSVFFIYSVGKITSAIILFFKDLGQIVNIVLDIGMWATPIIWSYTIVPEKFQWIIKLNPVFYIINGYRDSFINQVWFYEDIGLTVYFWVIMVLLFFAGNTVYKRLKPQFADVL